MQKTVLTMVTLLSGFAATSAMANGFYLGARAGYIEHKYVPDYTFNDGSIKSFYNKGYGMNVGLVGGYAWQFDRLGLAVQTNFDMNNAKWDMATPENQSELQYKIPYNYGVSLLPSYNFTSKLALYLELGVQRGYVNQVKTSGLSDAYSAKQNLTGVNFGGGLAYSLTDKLKLNLGYQQIHYQSLTYGTYYADGSQRSSVTDKPTTQMVNLGVNYSIN